MRTKTCQPDKGTQEAADVPAWVIDPGVLEVGDVILSTTESIISTGIRIATRSAVSHAALHVGGGFIIEAVEEGVRCVHVRSLVFPKEQYVRILRPAKCSAEERTQASRHARSLLYRPYSIRGAIGAVLPFCRAPEDPGRFCSQLVAEAYFRADAPLIRQNPQNTTPDDLLRSSAMTAVPDAKREGRLPAILHSLREMQPDWTIDRKPSGGISQVVSAERFEAEVLKRAERVMRKYNCFRRPYHFFDVLRHRGRVQERGRPNALVVANGDCLLASRGSRAGTGHLPMVGDGKLGRTGHITSRSRRRSGTGRA